MDGALEVYLFYIFLCLCSLKYQLFEQAIFMSHNVCPTKQQLMCAIRIPTIEKQF